MPALDGPEGQEFDALLDRIRERSGIDFSTYKPATINRRLRGRMGATGHTTLAGYAKQLESDPEEYARLISSLLIKVTEFFRDPKVFQYLRDQVLPALIEDARHDGRQLRVWSAGCATGEEAYSLAITLSEAIGDDGPVDVRVFATDIDRDAIAFARRGMYPPAALQNVAPHLRARYFTKSDGGYEVVKSLRSRMIFGEHDLGARAPFPRIDLILCRNVLIYFNLPMQRAALETFGFSLRDDGRLVLGPSETIAALPGEFVEDNPRMRVYRRCAGDGTAAADSGRRRPGCRATVRRNSRSAIRTTRRDVQVAAESTEAAEALLLDLGLGVVVVDLRYYIMRINTAARRMLGIHGRGFDQDFIHLAESLPSTAIRAAIDDAFTGRTTVAVYEIEGDDVSADGPRFIQIVVRPYVRQSVSVEGALLELTDVSAIERDRRAAARAERRIERAAVIEPAPVARQRRADLARGPAAHRQPDDAPVERGGAVGARGGRDPQRGVPGDERGARDAQRGADRERRRAPGRERGPRRPDRGAAPAGGRPRGAEAAPGGGAQPPRVGPRQPR